MDLFNATEITTTDNFEAIEIMAFLRNRNIYCKSVWCYVQEEREIS